MENEEEEEEGGDDAKEGEGEGGKEISGSRKFRIPREGEHQEWRNVDDDAY